MPTTKGRYNMKYFVISTHWDDEREAAVKYIVGEFDKYNNARIFKEAFNANFSTHAVIVEDFAIVNQ